MGGRGGAGGALNAVLKSSKKTIQISGSVYFDDAVHAPSTHRQKDIPQLLSGINDIVVQVNNDKQGEKQLGKILAQGFFVSKAYKQTSNTPYLRNYYYIKRRKS